MDRKDIANYLWNRSPSHLKDNQIKEEKDSYKLIEIWSGRGSEVREAMKLLRLNRFPQTSTIEALYLLAKERGIEKFDFETEEEFRSRVTNALDWHRLRGTVKGIKTILKICGLNKIEIIPALKENKNQWSEFNLIIESLENKNQIEQIINLVNLVKPTTEKLSSISDGNCKQQIITDDTYLDKVLWDEIEGSIINNVKVCFVYKADLSTKINKQNCYINTTSKNGNYAFYPFYISHDSFTLDYTNIDTQLIDIEPKSIYQIKADYKASVDTNSLTIYQPELSDEHALLDEGTGFIGHIETVEPTFFDEFTLDSQIVETIPVVNFDYLTQNIKTNPIKTTIYSDANIKIKTPIYTLINTKINTYQMASTKTQNLSKVFKRNWKGFWKGKWTDNYQIQTTIEVM